ncbi:hypothetical protein HZ99_15825 [Pseudomonas fluorescens]|nr:hypothetical protein HZ99_15825 [Pseudomonas fluorescens]
MVVKVINQFDVIIQHTKNDAPVTADADGTVAEQIAFEPMKAPSREIALSRISSTRRKRFA